MLLVEWVVLRELLQEGDLRRRGLAHGVVVADHLEGHLRGRGCAPRTRPTMITPSPSS